MQQQHQQQHHMEQEALLENGIQQQHFALSLAVAPLWMQLQHVLKLEDS